MNNVIQLSQPQQASQVQLPETYENAKRALSVCVRMDECKDWADKAAALASYARQSNDKTMEKLAARIRARAIRRCGELLRQVEPDKGTAGRTGIARSAPSPQSRKAAATEAGLSSRQMKTAIRLANVPAEEFEALVESEDPPGTDEIAKRGTKSRQVEGTTYLRRAFIEAGDTRSLPEIGRAIKFKSGFDSFKRHLDGIDDLRLNIKNLTHDEAEEVLFTIQFTIERLEEIEEWVSVEHEIPIAR